MRRFIHRRLDIHVVVCLAFAAALAAASYAFAEPAPCGGDSEPAATKKAAEPAAPGTKPKLLCDASSITLEPIWAGKPLSATWVIKNEGDANLVIKIKKG